MFPALHLYPLNDSFVPKHIALLGGQRVKIGRQTNAKTVPGERNGFFDSKVLSRQHAEVWEEAGKIFIKDVKSSNGTFINGDRLSPEAVESEPFELKTDDIVEFGIDIVSDDNKTIIHHKVAARVACVFSAEDALRADQQHAQSSASSSSLPHPPSSPSSSSSGSTFNFSGQRRPTLQPQGLGGMGGMGGGGVRQPGGKTGLTFDHILSRLQGELQKSRETGAELHSLTGSMSEIHDTLGGAMPPPYPHSLPPVRPSQPRAPGDPDVPSSSIASGSGSAPTAPADLTVLQTQLHETQNSLATHVDKIRALEGVLAEHEAIKREVGALREMMDDRRRDMQGHVGGDVRKVEKQPERQSEVDSGDEDDARSVGTVTQGEMESLGLEEEEDDEERRRRREELGRPRTPEPTGMGMGMGEYDDEPSVPSSRPPNSQAPRSFSPSIPAPVSTHSQHHHAQPHQQTTSTSASTSMIPDELSHRLSALAEQLEAALLLSRTLQSQHSVAQSTIAQLETKVAALESLVQTTQLQVQAQGEAHEMAASSGSSVPTSTATTSLFPTSSTTSEERESLTQMLTEWKTNVEGQWSGVKEEWTQERERLSRAREEWENRTKVVEEGFGTVVGKLESGLAAMTLFQNQFQASRGAGAVNGIAKGEGGLVTPPSPRSLSSDSNRPRQRRRRSNSRAQGQGRRRSTSPGVGGADSSEDSIMGSSLDSSATDADFDGSGKARDSWTTDDPSNGFGVGGHGHVHPGQYPLTPESSMLHQPLSNNKANGNASSSGTKGQDQSRSDVHMAQVSTAVGVLVLGVAAAAVMWRVKPE